MKTPLLFFLFLALPFLSNSQTDCACCSKAYQKFDFWLGDWEVYNASGEKIGENLIEKLENNCIVSENWKGEKGGTGKSYNYFNPADSSWNQLWISNTGNILKLKGSAEASKMSLKSALVEGKNGTHYNQITWTKNPDGSVTQLWEIYDAEGNFIRDVFKGIYRKKEQFGN